jgi:hypothetical protein
MVGPYELTSVVQVELCQLKLNDYVLPTPNSLSVCRKASPATPRGTTASRVVESV